MLSGSQHWVYQEMFRHAAAGHPARTHEELNAFFVARMRALTEGGRVSLPGCNSAAATSALFADFPWGTDTPVSVEQVEGRAGDVILMHPLLLHSGTSNEGTELRLMANGMVRPRVFCSVVVYCLISSFCLFIIYYFLLYLVDVRQCGSGLLYDCIVSFQQVRWTEDAIEAAGGAPLVLALRPKV
jgi:hypothetical protein